MNQNTNTNTNDPLAHASATPDVAALITEFTQVLDNGPAQVDVLASAEDTRLNRWPGKSPNKDGVLRQINQPAGKVVKPYDNRPDTDVNLCDELIGAHVDMDYFARKMARLDGSSTHLTGLTAAKAGELKTVANWCRRAVKKDLRDGGELLSQMKYSIGWAVLRTGWREKWGLVERTVTMDEVFAAANAAFQQHQQMVAQGIVSSDEQPPLVSLPMLIADETLEDQAIELVQGILPHLKKKQVRTIVRELRDEGTTTFLDRQLEFKGPYLQPLIPGVNVFVSGATGDAQKARGWLTIEFYYQADLEAMALEGWNEEFIEAALSTAGDVTSRGRALRSNSASDEAHDRRIEIWTTEVRQYDEDTGVCGIYCTTFSPHLSPGGSAAAGSANTAALRKFYARHYLLDSAHGQYPYIIDRVEVIGPALDDSRGVPHKVRADQNQIKLHQDALAIRAQWEVNPAVIKIGSGWSKIKEPLSPGADLTLPPGGDARAFALDRGNPQVGASLIDRIEAGTRRRFALPNNGENGDHPSLWQLRQSRLADRTLGAYEAAYLQLVILCYQEFSPDELAQIIGREPMLTIPDLLQCQVELSFDARSLDNDWRKDTLDTFVQLLGIDNGGLIDRAPLIRVIGSMTDTTLMDEVLRSPAGAKAQMYRKVSQDVLEIMTGNPPPLVEMDASAGMQLEMAMQILQQNQKYQAALKSDPAIQENLKTYLENLQHSQQETQLSPTQGRLGVAALPERPVQKGNAMQVMG